MHLSLSQINERICNEAESGCCCQEGVEVTNIESEVTNIVLSREVTNIVPNDEDILFVVRLTVKTMQ